MGKITVESCEFAMSDHFLHKTSPPRLSLSLRRFLPLSVQNIFGRTRSDVHPGVNTTNMKQGPFILDSMFPSLFDGIRLGRSYASTPHMKLSDTRESNKSSPYGREPNKSSSYVREPSKSSSGVRIIPIGVSGGQGQKTFKSSNEINPIILDDEPADVIDCTIEDSLASTKGVQKSLNRLTSNVRKTTDSTIILDDEDIQEVVHLDDLSPIDSKCSSLKSLTESHSGVDTVNIKPLPVQHLEPMLQSHTNNKANSSRLQLSNSIIIRDDGIDKDDINFLDRVISNDPSCSNTLELKIRNDHFEELKDSPPPIHPTYDMLTAKLARENRKIHYITGDGNCFFRALSKIIYGCEQFHKGVRALVIDIIATNKSKFAQFIDGQDVQEHIEKMSEDRCWATTCEIYGAATALQSDIFMLTPNNLHTYSWLLFKPVFRIPQNGVFTKYQCCITLCNTNGIHYDLIVADHGKCNCFLPHPELGGISAVIDLS